MKGLMSSELEQTLLKATRPDDKPVKSKHVSRLVGVTYQIPRHYDLYDPMLRKLWAKCTEGDCRTTLKAMYLLHAFAMDGSPEHANALKTNLRNIRLLQDPKRLPFHFFSNTPMVGDTNAATTTPTSSSGTAASSALQLLQVGGVARLTESQKLVLSAKRRFVKRYAAHVLFRAATFRGKGFEELVAVPDMNTATTTTEQQQQLQGGGGGGHKGRTTTGRQQQQQNRGAASRGSSSSSSSSSSAAATPQQPQSSPSSTLSALLKGPLRPDHLLSSRALVRSALAVADEWLAPRTATTTATHKTTKTKTNLLDHDDDDRDTDEDEGEDGEDEDEARPSGSRKSKSGSKARRPASAAAARSGGGGLPPGGSRRSGDDDGGDGDYADLLTARCVERVLCDVRDLTGAVGRAIGKAVSCGVGVGAGGTAAGLATVPSPLSCSSSSKAEQAEVRKWCEFYANELLPAGKKLSAKAGQRLATFGIMPPKLVASPSAGGGVRRHS